jgi:hypothetical protein
MARLDEQFEAARLTSDIPWMQEIAAEQTLLLEAMYCRTPNS